MGATKQSKSVTVEQYINQCYAAEEKRMSDYIDDQIAAFLEEAQHARKQLLHSYENAQPQESVSQ